MGHKFQMQVGFGRWMHLVLKSNAVLLPGGASIPDASGVTSPRTSNAIISPDPSGVEVSPSDVKMLDLSPRCISSLSLRDFQIYVRACDVLFLL